MARLAQTEGLDEIQVEILAAVHEFTEREIIPAAQELEHSDTYPTDIVEGMKELGEGSRGSVERASLVAY